MKHRVGLNIAQRCHHAANPIYELAFIEAVELFYRLDITSFTKDDTAAIEIRGNAKTIRAMSTKPISPFGFCSPAAAQILAFVNRESLFNLHNQPSLAPCSAW